MDAAPRRASLPDALHQYASRVGDAHRSFKKAGGDPALVERARTRAEHEGVSGRTRFEVGNLFEADLSDATVAMLYLQPEPNLRLRPRLRAELPPGARVVSHSYDMGDWPPDEMRRVAGRRIYLWRIAGP